MSEERRDDLLSQLAALAGLEPAYFDIFGHRHETSIETKAHVLSALGFDTSPSSALEAAVSTIEEAPWRDGLAPYVVRTAHAPGVTLDLFLPAERAHDHWHWQITLESGDMRQGTYRPADLPLLGSRDISGQRIEQRCLDIREPIPIGYHHLRNWGTRTAEATLVVAPPSCYLPRDLSEETCRQWGLAAHLYSLTSSHNWGIGDFSDLARLCRLAGERGAAAIATNPFHALFPHRPEDASPYSPSSRLFLNPIYIDVTAVPGFFECSATINAEWLASLRDTKWVDYPKVWAAKLNAFETLFAKFHLRYAHANAIDAEVADFRRFIAEGGAALEKFAAFSVLDELHRNSTRESIPWTRWAERYRAPDSQAVGEVAVERADRVLFHQYLQYHADRQLTSVAAQGSALVRDLALGTSPDGADCWMLQKSFGLNLRCGAPPDDFHPEGQEWGVVPLHPLALRRDYSPFITMLRANMRHTGGLRIDHIIGLQRQFMVPLGERPSQGCYINFPFEEMTAIIALESQRNACMVIGEDLGTVPKGFRDRMHAKAMFGCAVLYFERREDGGFKAPSEYPRQAAAIASTHDLPTLVGYWRGQDIAVRQRLGIYSDAAAQDLFVKRRRDCHRLLEALAQAGFSGPSIGANPDDDPTLYLEAVHSFLAAASAKLSFVQLDDLFAEVDQLNVPGTIHEYPNWRRKLSVSLDAPAFAEAITAIARICAARGRDITRVPQG